MVSQLLQAFATCFSLEGNAYSVLTSGRSHRDLSTFSILSKKIFACAGVNISAGLNRIADAPQPPQFTPSFRIFVKIWSRLAPVSQSMAQNVPSPLAECRY